MKIGFYQYIKEYIINLPYRSLAATLLLCLFIFQQSMANGLMQTPAKAGFKPQH